MTGITRGAFRSLDRLYGAAHLLACLSIAVLAALIVVQVLARALDGILKLLGLPIVGFIIPSLAEIAGFLFVAGTFLALASTLRHGVHIRVTLLLDNVPAPIQRALKIATGLLGAALFGYAAYHAIELVRDSIKFDEVSYGIIAIPLAIPQAAMAAGLVLFALAMLHEAARALAPADVPPVAEHPGEEPATGHGDLDTHNDGPAIRTPAPREQATREPATA